MYVASSSSNGPDISSPPVSEVSPPILRSRISTAQARCLEMQSSQHDAEMEILKVKMHCMKEVHKRRMEVLDMEYSYWSEMGQENKQQ